MVHNFRIHFVVRSEDALHDLVSFVQFKKRGRHPWRSVTNSKIAGLSLRLDSLLKVKLMSINVQYSKYNKLSVIMN